MVILKSREEIEKLREVNALVAEFFEKVGEIIEPGISTFDLEEFSEKFVREKKVIPAFKGYMGYPANLCVSINEEVVHGIPDRKRVLKEGDLVSIDFGLKKDGFFGDAARTFPVGQVDEAGKRLLAVTEEALYRGIEEAKPGRRLYDISAAIQEFVEGHGFSVVRDYVGHGIGRSLHEDPQVPNFGVRGTGIKLLPGLVIAIEPMVNEGGHEVEVLKDGWTVVTKDRKRSAHFEHSVAVTENGALILSTI
ncbi:MAG: type I methionyl aminopeptidase [Deltaproteobacteria bacterium]|nr:MAG: type I methionyl aminopeptidase [Deltaproteobacteria bacterium]